MLERPDLGQVQDPNIRIPRLHGGRQAQQWVPQAQQWVEPKR